MIYCLQHKYFPPEWKRGRIVVIPKPGADHSKIDNYRPITLLPCIGKLFEKLIKNKIQNAIENCIPSHQFGFRKGCSTLHPITILISNIQTAKLNNQKSAACFLDIKKAFDSVWHRGLLYKLHMLRVPSYLIFIIRSFLENRELSVSINDQISKTFTAQQGVPQGSPLSPQLYNIFCFDFIEQQANLSSYALQYADDTVLISHKKTLNSTIEDLQNQINNATVWFNKWRLQINPLKSQFIIFYHSPKNTSPAIDMTNLRIRPTEMVKYLGINLDNKVNLKHHTKQIKRKIISRAKHFRALTYRSRGINLKTATKIYKAICRPLLEYGHPIFMNCRNPTLNNIRVAETSALRVITKIRNPINALYKPSNRLLYHRTRIKPIESRLNDLNTKFAKRERNATLLHPFLLRRQRERNIFKYPMHTLEEMLTVLAQN